LEFREKFRKIFWKIGREIFLIEGFKENDSGKDRLLSQEAYKIGRFLWEKI